jgi:hypothetical protein
MLVMIIDNVWHLVKSHLVFGTKLFYLAKDGDKFQS